MADSFKYKNDDRIYFGKGIQRKFLIAAIQKTNFSQACFSKEVSVSSRTLTDWLREKYWITYKNAMDVHELSGVRIPKILQHRDKYWYARKGAVQGGNSSFFMHGFGRDEEKRKAAWHKWWNTQGKKRVHFIGKEKEYKIPGFSKRLAEFFGIMIGDGGMSKYQCFVTLDSETDIEYSRYVEHLLFSLFGVKPTKLFLNGSRALDIYISRKGVVNFLQKNGLRVGNKLAQGLDIPNWIKENENYSIACLRGLIDTDGCIIHETHHIHGKIYRYARINFTTASPALAKSVFDICNILELKPKYRHKGRAVQIENKQKMWEYFKTVGTSNPKHLRRWQFVAGRGV